MDIDIDMTNCMRNQHTQNNAVNLIQQWKKECKAAEERTNARFTQKKNGSKKTGTLNTNQELMRKIKQTDNNRKIWNQVQKKRNKILKDFFKLRKRKSEEETDRNIRSLSETLNITNDPLLPILKSLETEAATENNDATEEPIEADFLEELQSVIQEDHDSFQTGKNKDT